MKKLMTVLFIGFFLACFTVLPAQAGHPDKDIGVDAPDVTLLRDYNTSNAHDAVEGDIDGNGRSDLIVKGQLLGGKGYVGVYFDATLSSLSGRDLVNPDFKIVTAKVYPWNWHFIKIHPGRFLAVSDFNSDGFDDILFALPGTNTPTGIDWRGEVYIVLGDTRGNLGTLRDFSLNPPDFTFFGVDPGIEPPNPSVNRGDSAGWSVGAGDLNGDGRSDVIIGAPWADGPNNAFVDGGEVYVITRIDWSRSSMTLTKSNVDLYFYGEAGQQFGADVITGNVNGDVDSETGNPIEDLIIAPRSGPVKLVYGRGSERRLLDDADWTSAYTLCPRLPNVSTGDVNSDGLDDFLVGGCERAYLTYGALGLPQTTADVTFTPVDPDMLGHANFLADADGDGFDDLLLLAPGGQGRNNQFQSVCCAEGEAYIVFGQAAPLPSTFNLRVDTSHTTIYGSDGSGPTGIKTEFKGAWASAWGFIRGMELDGVAGSELIFGDNSSAERTMHIYNIGPHPGHGGSEREGFEDLRLLNLREGF